MATSLPRGLQKLEWRNKDGSTSTRYKVRIVRKDFQANKNFESLEEAKEFLALTKAKKGKELIYSITEEERKKKQKTKKVSYSSKDDEQVYSYGSFGYFCNQYIEDYINSKAIETELQQRNKNNKLSFFRTIKNTSILDRFMTVQEKEELYIDTQVDPKIYRRFGGLDVRNIRKIDINNYIKARLHFVKPISVAREITYISNVFNKLAHFDESYEDVINPTKFYDRDLLGDSKVQKREVIISPELEEKIFSVLSESSNKELYKISMISLLTACRKSEIVYLQEDQIHDTYIQLNHTKSGKPRKVFLTKEAKAYISSLTPYSNGRFFNYTIGGMDRVFRATMQRAGLNKSFTFHDLRRTNISRLLTRLGNDNTILATEVLGISSVRKFEALHTNYVPTEPTTQLQAMKSFGHSNAQVTKGYFNIVFKPMKIDINISENTRKKE